MLRLSESLARILRGIATVMLIAVVAINAANVVGRYVLSAPFSWGEEVMLFLMIGAVFLSVPVVAWQGGNIHMDVLVRAFPPRARRVLQVSGDLFTCAVISLVWITAIPVIKQLVEFDERSHAAEVPMALPQSAIPIGLGLAALAIVVRQFIRPNSVQESE